MDENRVDNENSEGNNENRNRDENPKDTENNRDDNTDIEQLRKEVEQAQQMLIREKNRRVFERASEQAGIRSNRIQAAMKLAAIDSISEPLDDRKAQEFAEKILANYPEFSQTRSPIETDQGLPGTSRARAKMSGNPLEILRILRKG